MTMQKANKSCHVIISTTPFFIRGPRNTPCQGKPPTVTGSTMVSISQASTKRKKKLGSMCRMAANQVFKGLLQHMGQVNVLFTSGSA